MLCVIGKKKIIELVDRFKCIYPFNLDLLDGDGYVLTVKDEKTLHYLEHQNLISHEVVFVPPDYVAHLTANAAKIHSGFVGRLALELVNLSNNRQPITIKRGDPLMHMEFITREGEPSPYAGEYMFQYMTDEETSLYASVLSKNFGSVFPADLLQRMNSRRMKV
jgi:dCTP deaminase